MKITVRILQFIIPCILILAGMDCASKKIQETVDKLTNGGESLPKVELVDNLDGTVWDKTQNLVWKKCIQGVAYDAVNNTCATTSDVPYGSTAFQYCDNDWDLSCNYDANKGQYVYELTGSGNSSAYQSCNALNSDNSGQGFANRQGWRVPTLKELDRLLMPKTAAPNMALDTTIFDNTPKGSDYITSTRRSDGVNMAYTVDAVTGEVFYMNYTAESFLRCVTSQAP